MTGRVEWVLIGKEGPWGHEVYEAKAKPGFFKCRITAWDGPRLFVVNNTTFFRFTEAMRFWTAAGREVSRVPLTLNSRVRMSAGDREAILAWASGGGSPGSKRGRQR